MLPIGMEDSPTRFPDSPGMVGAGVAYRGIEGNCEGFWPGGDMSVRSDMNGEQHKVMVASAPEEAVARRVPVARPATPLDLPVHPACAAVYPPCHLPSLRCLKCAARGTSLWGSAGGPTQ